MSNDFYLNLTHHFFIVVLNSAATARAQGVEFLIICKAAHAQISGSTRDHI